MGLVLVKSYWTAEEKADGIAKAKQLGCPSFSDFVRRLGTGARLPNPGNAQSVIDLLKVNADLARLGNLLKLAIDEEKTSNLSPLIDDITRTQSLLKSKIKALQ